MGAQVSLGRNIDSLYEDLAELSRLFKKRGFTMLAFSECTAFHELLVE
jgi:hypothetical protein